MGRLTFQFGLNETEATQESEAKEGWNFDLELGATRLFPRKPIDSKGTLPNAGSVNGIMQLIQRDDTETTLIYGGACTTPSIYSWTGVNTSTAFTSERTTNLGSSSMLRGVYWSLDDYITLVDLRKVTPLLNWDGTDLTRHKTGLTLGSPTSTTLTCSSGTVTATATTHGLAVGDLQTIAGANESTFNGEYEVTTVPSANAFTYEITSCPTTTATGTITFDKGVELFAKYSVIHNGRMWLFNIKTDADDNPHMILASKFEDPKSFDTVVRSGAGTGNDAFYQLSPDLKPINGVSLINKILIISTVDGGLFKLTGVDASDYAFTPYFAGSASVGEESMVNMGNDVAYMRKGGNIDLLSATDTSGDVRADDVSRWIPDTVKDLTGALTVYDQTNQKVLFILDNKVLVLFKDILYSGGGSPWSVYKTQLTNSFTTKAAGYIRRPGAATYSVYFGDSDGNIFDLNGTGTGDNSSDIIVSRRTPIVESAKNVILRGNVQYRRLGNFSGSLIFDWANEYNQTQSDINFKGPPSGESNAYYGGTIYYGGSAYYNQGFAFSDKVSRQNFSPAGRAEAFNMTFYTETTVQFQIDHIELLS